MKKVLFVGGSSDTHLKTFVPVARCLKDTYGIGSVVLFMNHASTKVNGRAVAEVQEEASEFIEFMRDDLNPSPVAVVKGVREFQRLADRVVDRVKPDLIIVGNQEQSGHRCLLKQAHYKRIASLLLQEGIIWEKGAYAVFGLKRRIYKLASISGKFLLSLIEPTSLKWKIQRGNLSRVAAWGPYFQRLYVKQGVQTDKIVVTGEARFDAIVSRDWSAETTEAFAALNLGAEDRVVLFLPDSFTRASDALSAQDHREVVSSVIGAVKQIDARSDVTCRLVIKLHYATSMTQFHDLLPESLLEDVRIVQGVDLYPLLSGCDVAITSASTAGLEALLFGKPLITVNLTTHPDLYNYASSGAALGVNRPDDMEEVLAQALFDDATRTHLVQSRERYLEDQVYRLDGRSTERVAQVISSLVGEPTR